MATKIQIATFENGELRTFGSGDEPSEAVLALPLNRLLTAVVRVTAERKGEARTVASEALGGASPYPDEPLTVGMERVRECDDGSSLWIAAALPESSADDVGAALDENHLNVTRIDALALGELRALWPKIGDSDARRLLLFNSVDCISLFVMDGDAPVAIRALSPDAFLSRETRLSLLQAELVAGAAPLSEIVLVGFDPAAGEELAAQAPVRRIVREGDENEYALDGVAARSAGGKALDATPESWREVLAETRFKAKLRSYVGVAVFFWALGMGVLFGVPFGYGYLTDRQKAMSKEHRRQYEEVRTVKDKVAVVKKYSDHSRGSLETMLAVNACLPPLPADAAEISVELVNWIFKRGESVKFSGEAANANLVYDFKNRLAESGAFADVLLSGPQSTKGGRQRFDIECLFEAKEAE